MTALKIRQIPATSTFLRSAPSCIGSTRVSCRFARRARSTFTFRGENTTSLRTCPTASACRLAWPRPWSTTASANWWKTASAKPAWRPFYKWFEHDGVRGPNIATVYSDRGVGVRPPVVFYNRANEAGALLKAGDFDWAKIFAAGVRWFHSGGIFAALSETTSPLIVEGMKAAKAAGAIVSFDLNYSGQALAGQRRRGRAQACSEGASRHCRATSTR